MKEELRRWALMGSGLAELTRNRAEGIVKEMVSAGEVKRKQASRVVKELMDSSAANRRELVAIVRSEIRGQMENLGVATKRDVERLERRVARLEAAPAPAARKTTGSKTTAKKTTRRKSTTRRGASTDTNKGG